MPSFDDCDENYESEWLENDENDLGYQTVYDKEITNTAAEAKLSLAIMKMRKVETSFMRHLRSSHTDAFNILGSAMLWLEKQPECSTTNGLQILLQMAYFCY